MSSVSISHKSPLVTGGQVSKSPPPSILKVSRPRWHVARGSTHNPLRRLVAAVVVQAVLDAHYTDSRAPKNAAAEAHDFLQSPNGKWLLRLFVGRQVTQ